MRKTDRQIDRYVRDMKGVCVCVYVRERKRQRAGSINRVPVKSFYLTLILGSALGWK